MPDEFVGVEWDDPGGALLIGMFCEVAHFAGLVVTVFFVGDDSDPGGMCGEDLGGCVVGKVVERITMVDMLGFEMAEGVGEDVSLVFDHCDCGDHVPPQGFEP